jgi:hypothetical protein
VPKDSVIQFETAVKADSFWMMAHGPAEEVARAKAIIGTYKPSSIDVHTGVAAEKPADSVNQQPIGTPYRHPKGTPLSAVHGR